MILMSFIFHVFVFVPQLDESSFGFFFIKIKILVMSGYLHICEISGLKNAIFS